MTRPAEHIRVRRSGGLIEIEAIDPEGQPVRITITPARASILRADLARLIEGAAS